MYPQAGRWHQLSESKIQEWGFLKTALIKSSSFIQLESSLSRTFEGTGLGLTLAKKYVEMHGGNISVESKTGKGSSFKVELPVNRQKTVRTTIQKLDQQIVES